MDSYQLKLLLASILAKPILASTLLLNCLVHAWHPGSCPPLAFTAFLTAQMDPKRTLRLRQTSQKGVSLCIGKPCKTSNG